MTFLPSLQKLAVTLTYPPALSAVLLGLAALLLIRYRRAGIAVVAAALGWSALWSLPVASDWLRQQLEKRYPVVDTAQLPRADAVVVLGGGSRYAWLDTPNPRPQALESSRLAAAARAWQAGRAPRVVLSGGGEDFGSEARTMAKAIAYLGVPASALVLEERSRNTRDNARYTAELTQRLGLKRVLLVTSSVHMPRAYAEFRRAGVDAYAAPVPERSARRSGWRRWLPSGSALWRSGRAFKEYVGLLAVAFRLESNAARMGATRSDASAARPTPITPPRPNPT